MAVVYLALGTNLGNKEVNLRNALNNIKERIGSVSSLSAFHATEPWGFKSDNTFLNAVCCVETLLSPHRLLEETKKIEKDMGRDKKSINMSYSDRIIDIDILLYDNLILKESALVIPHPLMLERDFVMRPLLEIAPDLIHPVFNKKMKDIISGKK